ncbi:MAG: class I SAM-dependent methyltransferase [Deltaproteobacteria bacterium]|nr:class I SAM-dependent methyltransferase [Deltaproteobacteria bacterium]
MQTIELAKVSNGKIVAWDNHQPFLDILTERVKKEGVEKNITPINMSMLDMDFKEKSFDIIWAEGSLYIMGFKNGLKKCGLFLKDNGFLAVTELVYIASDPHSEVVEYFNTEYPDIKDVRENIEIIEKENFKLISNFTLPKSAWLDNYYLPMETELFELNKKYSGDKEASAMFDAMQKEIDLYKKLINEAS